MSYNSISLLFVLLASAMAGGCTGTTTNVTPVAETARPALTSISQINSFRPETACMQALEVVENNRYSQDFFEKVFARLVKQCGESKSPENADIIWNNFVTPLKSSGKVPPDLVRTTWNRYFSKQFVSLPSPGRVIDYCTRLPDIKQNIEKEYRMKKQGFEICEQGSPDAHFLNAMYVYNTMWAACR